MKPNQSTLTEEQRKFIQQLTSRLNSLTRGGIFTVEIDINKCFYNQPTSPWINQELLKALQQIKKSAKNKGAEFHVNICDNARLLVHGNNVDLNTDDYEAAIFKALFELNDQKPLFQCTASELQNGNFVALATIYEKDSSNNVNASSYNITSQITAVNSHGGMHFSKNAQGMPVLNKASSIVALSQIKAAAHYIKNFANSYGTRPYSCNDIRDLQKKIIEHNQTGHLLNIDSSGELVFSRSGTSPEVQQEVLQHVHSHSLQFIAQTLFIDDNLEWHEYVARDIGAQLPIFLAPGASTDEELKNRIKKQINYDPSFPIVDLADQIAKSIPSPSPSEQKAAQLAAWPELTKHELQEHINGFSNMLEHEATSQSPFLQHATHSKYQTVFKQIVQEQDHKLTPDEPYYGIGGLFKIKYDSNSTPKHSIEIIEAFADCDLKLKTLQTSQSVITEITYNKGGVKKSYSIDKILQGIDDQNKEKEIIKIMRSLSSRSLNIKCRNSSGEESDVQISKTVFVTKEADLRTTSGTTKPTQNKKYVPSTDGISLGMAQNIVREASPGLAT